MDATFPKVAISVWGRFHAFDLAKTLVERQALAQLITSYPRFGAERFGVPGDLVSPHPALEVLYRAWSKAPSALRHGLNAQLFFSELYDRFAQQSLHEDANVFVGWSGVSLHTLRRAKALGMVTVLERCSSHIGMQSELLTEEFRRFGLEFNETHPGIVEKELTEYAEADYVAIPSSFVRRSFLARGFPEKKLIQIPYGVNLATFGPVAKEDEKFRIIYCGSLSLRKGIAYLLEAFRALDLKNAELWLVGPVLPEIEPVLKRNADARIIVHGPKPAARLKWYYSQADLFCLPSIEEGLAYVQAQAMACGLPVLCTQNTGGEDLFQNGREGWVVPIRDPKALAEKILWAYENRPALSEMGQAARRRVSQAATWGRYGEKAFEAYTRALDDRRSLRRVG